MRLYAVGDIHGRDDLLEALMALVEADAARAPDLHKVLIFLGDYVDRGLQSKAVLDRLTGDFAPGFERVFLKGNHELALRQFMEDAAFGRSWKYYGGLETLHSYGITELTLSDDPADFERARQHFNETIPDKHREFLDNLQLTAEFGDYFFVHAGVRPGIALHRQIEEDLLWIREEFLDSSSTYGKVVVHGHTPRETVEFRPNRIGLDTGAYMTGVLTALVLEGEERRLIQTG
ncbi:metallophosphoesterase family protein [Parvibaculum sp.]|uniref:metallophosphoesterase family protein n=1 Tax=Parvibaculum sp. TaxID=2024848 RepID=UPI001DA472EA|nr:metallophosphoesterase family protein [Parvibaculum sp.]MBX3489225.1 serine/threonine protein phosphatase [Parvibaculum sp.]